jgi:hypothetical protein
VSAPRKHLPIARIDALDALLGRPAPVPPPPPPRLARSAEEPALADEVLRDYVLAPYPPRRDPTGGLRSTNLLMESFALAGVEDPGLAVIARLRELLGVGRTVWGIKLVDGVLGWELYIYDPGHDRPEARVDAVVAALAGLIAPPRLPPAIAYHMFSVELSAEALRTGGAGALTYYVHGADEPGASRSYLAGARGLELANLYTFHDPRRDARDVIARLRTSVHLGVAPTGIAAALWPELHRCRRVCVANKRAADGMYFSGIDTDQLGWFLEHTGWPAPLRASLDGNRHRYAHLCWDVGFDFARDPSGDAPRVTKAGIYGTC